MNVSSVILRLAWLGAVGGLTGSTPPAPPRVAEFVAREYAFGGPDSVAAGLVTLRLRNLGREPHQAALYRLDPRTGVDAVLHALLENRARPAGVTKLGGVESAQPGASAEVTVVLAPGRYLLACGLPAPDGRAHVAKGMVRAFTVTGAPRAASAARLPAADATLRMTEYAFTFSAPARAGRQRWRVVNAGAQAHHLMLNRLNPGITLRDVDAWNGKDPAPFGPTVGVAAMDSRQENLLAVTLAPGDYLLSCMLADARDGRPHFMHGMERVIHIAATPRTR
jgi:hypothetical protein